MLADQRNIRRVGHEHARSNRLEFEIIRSPSFSRRSCGMRNPWVSSIKGGKKDNPTQFDVEKVPNTLAQSMSRRAINYMNSAHNLAGPLSVICRLPPPTVVRPSAVTQSLPILLLVQEGISRITE